MVASEKHNETLSTTFEQPQAVPNVLFFLKNMKTEKKKWNSFGIRRHLHSEKKVVRQCYDSFLDDYVFVQRIKPVTNRRKIALLEFGGRYRWWIWWCGQRRMAGGNELIQFFSKIKRNWWNKNVVTRWQIWRIKRYESRTGT